MQPAEAAAGNKASHTRIVVNRLRCIVGFPRSDECWLLLLIPLLFAAAAGPEFARIMKAHQALGNVEDIAARFRLGRHLDDPMARCQP